MRSRLREGVGARQQMSVRVDRRVGDECSKCGGSRRRSDSRQSGLSDQRVTPVMSTERPGCISTLRCSIRPIVTDQGIEAKAGGIRVMRRPAEMSLAMRRERERRTGQGRMVP